MLFSLKSIAAPPQVARWIRLGLWVLFASYGVFIGKNFAPVASGADSGGYFNSARLLTEGTLTTLTRTVPEFQPPSLDPYVPLGYDQAGAGRLKPTYPIGLPLHYAVASLIVGWYWGPLVVAVLAALAAVFFCYRCLRELEVSTPLALAGAAALAVSPMFLFSSFVAMSDTVATAWCTITVYSSLRARRSVKWAYIAGVVFSVAVLVRPANAILLPALVLILGHWRCLLGAFLGGLPGAIWVGCYNRAMYGSPFRSGYGAIFDAFGWQQVIPSLKNYADTFPVVLPLAIPALLLLFLLPWKKQWRELAACFLWLASYFVFYAFYDVTQQAWWYLRFILPAFPAFIALGMIGLDRLVQRIPKISTANRHALLFVLVTTVSLMASVHTCKKRHVMQMKSYQQPYVIASDWINANLPKNALVVCMQTSSTFYFYTDFPILRWDQVLVEDRIRLESVFREAGRPVYAVLFAFEQDEALKDRLPWNWEKVAHLKDIGVWKLKNTP